MWQQIFDLLKSRISSPLTLIDVGAAGGVVESWRQFGDKARIFCFEAREEEAQDLSVENTDPNIEYIPIALSNDDSGITLTITSNLGCSSVYPPVRNLYERYPGCAIMRPIRNVVCPSTTLDAFIGTRGIETVDAIKLDTQGSELQILKGAEKALKHCKLLVVEVEFNALYDGQPLFCDVDRFLRDRGFVLWRFNGLAHYSAGVLPGEQHSMVIGADPGGHHWITFANGQLFFADAAIYVREEATPVNDKPLGVSDAVAGAALVSQWHFLDLTIDMIRKCGDNVLLSQLNTFINSEKFWTARWTRDRYSASEFRSNTLPIVHPFLFETDFSITDTCIVYGPYVKLPLGEQEAVFHIRALGLGDQELVAPITFDVAQDMIRIASVDLVGLDGGSMLRGEHVTVRFHNDTPDSLFEFRIFTSGRPFDGTLIFYGVSLD